MASIIAHDMGAPVIKVPVPAVPAGAERQRAVARVVASVSVPVLFLGGPRTAAGRTHVLDEVRDVMEGGEPAWPWDARSIRTPTRPRWPAWSTRWCTAGDPHIDFGTSVTKVGCGATTGWWRWPGPT